MKDSFKMCCSTEHRSKGGLFCCDKLEKSPVSNFHTPCLLIGNKKIRRVYASRDTRIGCPGSYYVHCAVLRIHVDVFKLEMSGLTRQL